MERIAAFLRNSMERMLRSVNLSPMTANTGSEPRRYLNIHEMPAVDRVLEIVAHSLIEKLASAYESQLQSGGAEFTADVWYRMELSDGPAISIMLLVDQPVYGLAPYLSHLSASVAESVDWAVSFKTSVRLAHEVEKSRLVDDEWRHTTFPPRLDPPTFSVDPPGGRQSELVDA